MSWWNSLEAVSQFNTWMHGLTLFLALSTATAGVFAWLSGKQATLLRMQRDTAAQQRLFMTLSSPQPVVVPSAEIVAHKTEPVTVGAVAAAAPQRKVVDSEIQAVVKQMKRKVTANRSLSLDQKKEFSKILRRGPKGPIEIIYVDGSDASRVLAEEIKGLFSVTGWNNGEAHALDFTNPPSGCVLISQSGGSLPHANVLKRAFEKIGIHVSNQEKKDAVSDTVQVVVGSL